eukprot:4597430-Heterocapsa_arctica.AAC.1
MRLDQQVEQVICDVRNLAQQNIFVLVWASLPCTTWCSWQRVNATLGTRTAQRLKEGREQSQLMLE